LSDLLIAVIGGSVGVLLPAAARATSIPTEVRVHDAAIADRDQQLGTWIADRHDDLGRECKAHRERLPLPTDNLTGEQHDGMVTNINETIASARELALHQYRDEERRAVLDRARILAAEGWAHRMWRRRPWGREPARPLLTPEEAESLLNLWRRASILGAGRPTPVSDPTKRTLQSVLRQRLIEP